MTFYISVTAKLENQYLIFAEKFKEIKHHKYHEIPKKSIHFTIMPILSYEQYDGFDNFDAAGKSMLDYFRSIKYDLKKFQNIKVEFNKIIWYNSGICFQLNCQDGKLSSARHHLRELILPLLHDRMLRDYPYAKQLLTPSNHKNSGDKAHGSWARNPHLYDTENDLKCEEVVFKQPVEIHCDIIHLLISDESLENSAAHNSNFYIDLSPNNYK